MKPLSKIFIIFHRELSAYFNSAIAYIFLFIFAFLNNGLFMTQFFVMGRADMRPFFFMLPFFLAVFLPAVSMRLWSEEKRGNTQELLLTFPMQPQDLVLGKFFASFVFYLLALLSTCPVPILLAVFGRPDMGMILSGYIGAAFLGGFFLAIGILVSGFCRDQIVSFILSMMICFGFYLVGMEFVASSLDGWVPALGTFLRTSLGATDHYISFAKGVVDNRDVLYFVIGSAVALVLNGFWIEGRMRPKAASIFTTVVVISAAIFLLSNWLVAGIPLGRFDMSEGKMYTISPATKKILKNLKSPVIAKLYISAPEKMPTSMKTLEQDICDKLDELKISSEGRFQYKIFHMDVTNITEGRKPGQKEGETLEEQLAQKGLEPFQVESIQSDEVGVRLVYSGMSLSYKEKPEEILPRIYPGNLYDLEYSIVSKIFRMTLPQSPEIMFVAPYEEQSLDPNVMALLQQLGGGKVPPSYRTDVYDIAQMGLESEGYPVVRLPALQKDNPISKETKTLVVLEPSNLSERQKYEINKFLYQGGSVFMAVQNYEYNYKPARGTLVVVPKEDNPAVNDLLSAWGLEVDTAILADDQSEIIKLSGGGAAALLGLTIPVKLPIQIRLSDAEMNRDVSITSRISDFFYMWGSALKINEAKIKTQGLKIQTLLHSTRNSWTVPFRTGEIGAEEMLRADNNPAGPFPLAILAEGQFADAFKGKTIPEWPSEKTEDANTPKMPESPESLNPAPGKLLLVGSATPFRKQLMQGGGHLNFLLNAIDVLSLGDELIGVRSKGPVDRTLPKASAAAKVASRVLVTLLIPGLVALLGFVRFYLRKRSKQSWLLWVKQSQEAAKMTAGSNTLR